MSNHLAGKKVNISLIQEHVRNELLKFIDKCDGRKVIVLDPSLGGPLGLVATSSILKRHDVVKSIPLKPGRLMLNLNDIINIVFITRPHLNFMDMIADNIRGEKRSGGQIKFHLIFVPRKSLLCEKRLQNVGVFGSLTTVEELTCELFPFDNDLVSMELENSFKEYYLENDPTCLFQAAQAIMTLQDFYGTIPRVSGCGQAAKHVWELMGRLALEPRKSHLPQPIVSQINHIVLIDRAVDLLTPLTTQLTYEGLIDEIFEINNSTVSLPPEKFSRSDDEGQEIVKHEHLVILNSGDDLFAEIRDKNFNAVGPALTKKAKLISSQLEEKHGEKTMQEMKQFVARLPHMLATKKSVSTHTTIAVLIKEITDSSAFMDTLQLQQDLMLCVDTDKIQPYIEDCIACKEPLVKVLRLICMQSFTNSGLKPKVLEYYKREIIQVYGFEHLLTLTNLEKVGLIKIQERLRTYPMLRKVLRLTVEDGSEVAPTDISYVHSVYAPLSVRLVQNVMRFGSLKNIADILQSLPGPIIDEVQTLHPGQTQRRGSIGSQSSVSDNSKVILVFFLGGCTFAEISALRFLSQQQDSNVEFVVATTKLINGNSFIKSLMENLSLEV
uniref:Vacuolar protein sorting-associated protein 33A n=1 Tax=Clastoptera arizonana TaxID=38151 RepID=A0A1B6E3U9_9HEMI